MHLKRIAALSIAIFLSLSLAGCQWQTGRPAIPNASKSYSDGTGGGSQIQLTTQKHEPRTLSNAYASAIAGIDQNIAAAKRKGEITQQQINLWEAVMAQAERDQFTQADLEAIKSRLAYELETLAKEHNMTLEEYLAQQDYDMTVKQAKDFLIEQAEKYFSSAGVAK